MIVLILFVNPDSATVQNKLVLNLSGSLVNLTNWKGESFTSYTIFNGTDYYYSDVVKSRQRVISGKSELGYTHIIDSLWNKQADLFKIQLLVKNQQQKISQSWNAVLSSQFLNSYKYETDIRTQSLKRKWVGSFMNPAAFELCYGMNVMFWQKSMINIGIASARLRVDPVLDAILPPAITVVGRVKRGQILFDYGVSGQYLVVKTLTPAIDWNSSGKIFLKGFDKSAYQFDISNTMSYKLWKYIEMRADLKWVYDPMISRKMQYRNEMLFGLVFKSEKSQTHGTKK